MDKDQKIALFNANFREAQETIKTIGDLKEHMRKFRECFKDGLTDLSDPDVIFVIGYTMGAQSAMEGMAEQLEELGIMDKSRKMFMVRDAGRA